MAEKPVLKTAALVLGGNGYGTAWEIGCLPRVLHLLKNHGVEVPIVSGVSGGAYSAATISQEEDMLAQSLHLKAVWSALEAAKETVDSEDPVFPFTKVKIILNALNPSLLDGSTLWGLADGKLPGVTKKLLAEAQKKSSALLGPEGLRWGIDFKKLATSARRCDISVLEKRSGDYGIFSNRIPRTSLPLDEEMRRALVASASIEGFFPSVLIDGAGYCDIGYIRLRQAFEMGVDLILVLLPYPEKEPVEEGDRWLSRAWVFRQFFINSAKTRHFNAKAIRHGIDLANIARRTGLNAPWIMPIYMSRPIPSLKAYTFRPATPGRKGDITEAMDLGEADVKDLKDMLLEHFVLQ